MKNGGNMEVVAYYRISSVKQEQSQLGLEAQKSAVRAHCKAHNLGIVAEHTDSAVSGSTPLEKRVGLVKALADISSLGASALVVAKIDRVARKMFVQLSIENALERMGARLISTAGEGTQDGDNPNAVFMRRIMTAVAEQERAMISLRTKVALAEKKKRGERLGQPPFGFSVKDGRLVTNECYPQLLKMFDLLKMRCSQKDIAIMLNMDNPQYGKWCQQKVSNMTRKWGTQRKLENFRKRQQE
jgi:site-specific DNA recombinase